MRPPRPSATLIATEVTAGYGGRPVVRAASLSAGKGEAVAVIGPNGAGKSTLLRAIAGSLQTSNGKISLCGRDVTHWSSERLARFGLGFVPQLEDVWPDLTADENLEMGGYVLSKSERSARQEVVLDLLPSIRGLLRRRAGLLSGGERKMVAIARALIPGPQVLLLDEPLAGLSESSVRQMFACFEVLRKEGVTLVLVEQKAKAALNFADWAYVLVAGEVYYESDASELLGREDVADVFFGGGELIAKIGKEMDQNATFAEGGKSVAPSPPPQAIDGGER